MIVDYVSDLHFNHWAKWTNNSKWEKRTRILLERLLRNKKGEVIVVAGDFGEWNMQALWILEGLSAQYEQVYFTVGNHDMYLISKSQEKKYSDSIGRVNELIELAEKMPNVKALHKNVDVYKGKVFAGDVMWYLPKTKDDWDFLNNVSNDSSYIKVNGYWRNDVTRKLHKDSMDWFEGIKDVEIDVFVSHVPPVHNPFSVFPKNYCYMVDVPFDNVKNWVCGHDHLQADFKVDNTKFFMNCLGYPYDYDKYEADTIPEDFVDKYKSFDIKSFEI